MKNILYTLILGIAAIGFFSCNDFLDELPDNRTEIDTEEKVGKILVAAYPDITHFRMAELSSDNIDDYGPDNPNSSRFVEEVCYWKDVTETDNDGPRFIWEEAYLAIANANQALEAIERIETDENSERLQPYKGEALVSRAYWHFILANMFCMHYDPNTAATNLGITYMEETETTLDPKYTRPSLADTYGKIERDLTQGLPLIQDSYYTVPKYHFNRNAALGFAVRFYLYKADWEKVIEYSTRLLGSNPSLVLRDWRAISSTTRDWEVWATEYINPQSKDGLMLTTAVTGHGISPGYSYNTRYAHGTRLNEQSTYGAAGPWGSGIKNYYVAPFVYTGNNHNLVRVPKMPYLFEYSDPVAQIGWHRTVVTHFTCAESLLSRAEAYAMTNQFDLAVADLNMWLNSVFEEYTTLNPTNIENFYSDMEYFNVSWGGDDGDMLQTTITTKYPLNPWFTVFPGTQECFIHCILHLRRIQSHHEGWRWFDLKRYDIPVYRLLLEGSDDIVGFEVLEPGDLRRALQLPQEVLEAGYRPNPR